jgi:hypothetical protein
MRTIIINNSLISQNCPRIFFKCGTVNFRETPSFPVIPAQAGIQEGERKNFWIPACAGMTWVERYW